MFFKWPTFREAYKLSSTTMDTFERLVMDDLKQNAVITASFVYNAAMRQAKLPGKPVMKARPDNERRLP